MAQLLVRVVDKSNPFDVRKDVKLTKRGDVVAVVSDDYAWGRMELSHPEWRILRWPSVTESQASVFLSPELPTEPPLLEQVIDPMLQKRGFYLNLDSPSVPKGMRAYLDDSTRASATFVVPDNVTLAQLKKQRPKRVDPTVIG